MEQRINEIIKEIERLEADRAFGRITKEDFAELKSILVSERDALIWELHTQSKEYKDRLKRAEARRLAKAKKEAEAKAEAEAKVEAIEAVELEGYTVAELKEFADEVDTKIVEYCKKSYGGNKFRIKDHNAKAIWDALEGLSYRLYKAKKEALAMEVEAEAVTEVTEVVEAVAEVVEVVEAIAEDIKAIKDIIRIGYEAKAQALRLEDLDAGEVTPVDHIKPKEGVKMDNKKCWFCNGQLIWQNDFNTEDIGIDEEGLVTVLTCAGCGASWEGVQLYADADELEEEMEG